jgi:hypothetical protein
MTVEIEGYAVRALTRGELRQLRKAGLAISQVAAAGDDLLADEAVDATLGFLFGEAVDAMPNPLARRLYLAVIGATYGTADDEKNSLSSGNGPPTRSVPRTAAPAGS